MALNRMGPLRSRLPAVSVMGDFSSYTGPQPSSRQHLDLPDVYQLSVVSPGPSSQAAFQVPNPLSLINVPSNSCNLSHPSGAHLKQSYSVKSQGPQTNQIQATTGGDSRTKKTRPVCEHLDLARRDFLENYPCPFTPTPPVVPPRLPIHDQLAITCDGALFLPRTAVIQAALVEFVRVFGDDFSSWLTAEKLGCLGFQWTFSTQTSADLDGTPSGISEATKYENSDQANLSTRTIKPEDSVPSSKCSASTDEHLTSQHVSSSTDDQARANQEKTLPQTNSKSFGDIAELPTVEILTVTLNTTIEEGEKRGAEPESVIAGVSFAAETVRAENEYAIGEDTVNISMIAEPGHAFEPGVSAASTPNPKNRRPVTFADLSSLVHEGGPGRDAERELNVLEMPNISYINRSKLQPFREITLLSEIMPPVTDFTPVSLMPFISAAGGGQSGSAAPITARPVLGTQTTSTHPPDPFVDKFVPFPIDPQDWSLYSLRRSRFMDMVRRERLTPERALARLGRPPYRPVTTTTTIPGKFHYQNGIVMPEGLASVLSAK